MKVSDISDREALEACWGWGKPDETSAMQILQAAGYPPKVALRKLEQLCDRRLIDCGVSLNYPWRTPEGEEQLRRLRPHLLCCVCGSITPEAEWTYWQRNPNEETEEETPWVPSIPPQTDPLAVCPTCRHGHLDDYESGFYMGTLEEVEAQRREDLPEYLGFWMQADTVRPWVGRLGSYLRIFGGPEPGTFGYFISGEYLERTIQLAKDREAEFGEQAPYHNG